MGPAFTASLRAEFRKLLTVRSTYVLTFLCLLIMLLVAFVAEGLKAGAGAGGSPNKLASEVTLTAGSIGLFMSIISILLFTHEYRYNTIMYSLTSARRRLYVLASKFIVLTVLGVVLTTILCVAAPFVTQLGLNLRGVPLTTQYIPFGDLLPRCLFYIWGFMMLSGIIAAIIRNQVGAIVTMLLLPYLGESLLTLLLRDYARYLPFTALNQVLQATPNAIGTSALALSHGQAALVVLAYIIIGWAVAAWLFIRRDAN